MTIKPVAPGILEPSLSASTDAAMQYNEVTISAFPKRILKFSLIIIGLLFSFHITALVMKFGFGAVTGYGFITLFDLNKEANIPTYFSSFLMASCAVFMVLLCHAHKSLATPWHRHWAFLGLVFISMSIDEISQIHEKSIEPLKHFFGIQPGDYLTNAWVILAFIFLPVMALLYFRFLMAMERRSAILFITSGAVYISGVAGVEMVSGVMKGLYSTQSLAFAISTTVEETLELLGLALFSFALTDYAARQKFIWRLGMGEHTR
ncbi:hypothetical protein DXV75_09790 [Alteromonas aestuariivivens]|uniref:Uncharacterized protein n=1 Tax=Alteromonas aestuariivivens TaxID=1938339 RepID=A0A3D8M714_9ALTE|nr:hypothetical protein [Alteromonas aestuariivivens]RDV25572.1 hypothetical protein DXV75_09790 [Alteromonas aestuariivivens]